jgi:hypothetical protein
MPVTSYRLHLLTSAVLALACYHLSLVSGFGDYISAVATSATLTPQAVGVLAALAVLLVLFLSAAMSDHAARAQGAYPVFAVLLAALIFGTEAARDDMSSSTAAVASITVLGLIALPAIFSFRAWPHSNASQARALWTALHVGWAVLLFLALTGEPFSLIPVAGVVGCIAVPLLALR